ncbi:chaperone protein DnaJ 49 [Tanacetum coccineum]
MREFNMFNLNSYVGLPSWSPGVRLVSKILGLGNQCSAGDTHRAYRRRKRSIMMDHLNINKTPGSDEALKKIEQAYKCLVDHDLRTCYDKKRKEEQYRFELCCIGSFAFLAFFGLIAFLVCALHNFPYSLKMYDGYEVPMMTNEYGVEFYVRSSTDFNKGYPFGTRARADIENNIIKEYMSMVRYKCDSELIKRREQRRDFPTPHCDKLQSMESMLEQDKISEIDKEQKEEHVDDTQSNVEELEEICAGDPIQSHMTIAPSEAESSIDHNRKTEEATKTLNSVHDIQRDREELRKKLNAEMKKVLGLTARERNKAVRMLAHDEDLMVIFFTVEDEDRLDILDMFDDSLPLILKEKYKIITMFNFSSYVGLSRSYDVRLVSKLNTTTNYYYKTLGVESNCSVKEINIAYTKWSFVINRDKNKIPASDEAIKKLDQAFKCLVDHHDSRACYDKQEKKRIDMLALTCFLVYYFIPVIARLHIALYDADYSLELYIDYKMPMMPDKYRIEFCVRSSGAFDDRYPSGTCARADIEDNIIKEYVNKIYEIDKEYCNPTQCNMEEMKEKHVDDPIKGPTFAPVEEKTSYLLIVEESDVVSINEVSDGRNREVLRKKLHAEMKKVLGLTDRERDKAVHILAQAEDLMVIFFTDDDEDRVNWILDMFDDTPLTSYSDLIFLFKYCSKALYWSSRWDRSSLPGAWSLGKGPVVIKYA